MCDGTQFVGLTTRLHRTTRLGDGCLKRRPYVSVAFAMSEWLEVLENQLDPHRLKVSGKDTGTHKINAISRDMSWHDLRKTARNRRSQNLPLS